MSHKSSAVQDNPLLRLPPIAPAKSCTANTTARTATKVEIQTLQQDIEVQERQIENLEQFIQTDKGGESSQRAARRVAAYRH